jgi:hypothetical protein
MNWIEIDKILYGIISRYDTVEHMLDEAKKQFKWNDSQAEAALLPLLERHTAKHKSTTKLKKRQKR